MPPRWPLRLDVATDRPERGGPLEEDLPSEQDECARDVEPVGEERPIAGVRALLGLHAADREDDLLGLAREQVAAARAAVDEQADAGGSIGLDAGAVAGGRARREQAGLLVDPAERGDVVVGAEQDPRLARARLRGEIGLPLGQVMRAFRDPARHVRGVAVPHRAPEHGQREAVDLEEDDARARPFASRLPAGGRSAGRLEACTCRRRSSRRSPRERC